MVHIFSSHKSIVDTMAISEEGTEGEEEFGWSLYSLSILSVSMISLECKFNTRNLLSVYTIVCVKQRVYLGKKHNTTCMDSTTR